MIRPILTYPDPFLRRKAVPVISFDDDLRALVRDMIETMNAADGAGLAATQVGDPRAVVVFPGSMIEREEPIVLVNPKLFEMSKNQAREWEGCLSFPGDRALVMRCVSVDVFAKDVGGKEVVLKEAGNVEGLFARALQHECDHLNGVLLIDRVGPVKRDAMRRRFGS